MIKDKFNADTPQLEVSEPYAGLLAQMALKKSGFSQPYGGPDWPQKPGYEIRHEAYRSTKQAILKAGGSRV